MKFTSEMPASQRKRLSMRILMGVMLTGIVFGTILFLTDSEKSYITGDFYTQRLYGENKTVFRSFADSFLSLTAILLFQLLCGFFALGQPFCLLTLFHRGAAGGVTASLIYCEQGMKGFVTIAVTLFPVLFINMYILVHGAREGIRLSCKTACFLMGKEASVSPELKLYFIRFLVLWGFAVICSALQCALTFIF